MNTKQAIQKIAKEIVENKNYTVIEKEHIQSFCVDVADARIVFITSKKNPSYEQFEQNIIENITEEFKNTKIFDSFRAGNWSISKQEDYNREWTQEEKEQIYRYGSTVVPAQTYDYVFTNWNTKEVFVVTRKARV